MPQVLEPLSLSIMLFYATQRIPGLHGTILHFFIHQKTHANQRTSQLRDAAKPSEHNCISWLSCCRWDPSPTQGAGSWLQRCHIMSIRTRVSQLTGQDFFTSIRDVKPSWIKCVEGAYMVGTPGWWRAVTYVTVQLHCCAIDNLQVERNSIYWKWS